MSERTNLASDATKAERVKFFATAPRASAGKIRQLEDGEFRTYWVGKLRGHIVSDPDTEMRYRFGSKDDALDCARRFREHARKEMEKTE